MKPFLYQVFVNDAGQYGDTVSLVVDEQSTLSESERIGLTAKIGNDETAFVNDLNTNDISIYHAQGEVDFAGTVLIGASLMLEQLKGQAIANIRCRRGDIPVWKDGDIYWLRTSLENNLGNWDYEQLTDVAAIDAIKVSDTNGWKKMVWAWADENKGLIRARTFADAIGMPEVHGNGSGSMNLANQLQREITILHGDGSVIYARPAPHNSAELGGRVVAL